jgi:hypothetical protein
VPGYPLRRLQWQPCTSFTAVQQNQGLIVTCLEDYLHNGAIIDGGMASAKVGQARTYLFKRGIDDCRIQPVLSKTIAPGIFSFSEPIAHQDHS